MNRLSIKEWAKEDRPREKMLLKGVASLTDAELLAILIGTGNNNETAVELSQRILHTINNDLNRLAKLSVKELVSTFRGIGTVKAITITAALELGKRRGASDTVLRNTLFSSRDAYELFYPILSDLPYEEVWIALTNRAHKLIDKVKISQGGTSETSADIRLILKAAIEKLAAGIVLCHNHPSGNILPSEQDDALTSRLCSAAKLIGMRLTDHIILTDGSFYSYADEKKLDS